MSKQGIYNQLVSEYGEQFTEDEAQYAVDNLEADYNYNALQKAKAYQDDMAMSPSAIYDQLISEYGEQFTEDEAQYAIDHLDD
ncbi:MAG: Ltp family lipoprotein [Lachnospiraceae bacterium]|nr:Ltp family lipoprotein [Lachnospiraceae bacterium]